MYIRIKLRFLTRQLRILYFQQLSIGTLSHNGSLAKVNEKVYFSRIYFLWNENASGVCYGRYRKLCSFGFYRQ